MTVRKSYLPEYKSWHSMKSRCYSDNYIASDKYMKRGIKVCDEWLFSFDQFYKDMGSKPSPQHSLDRIENDGNYEPGNCRWATKIQQSINRGLFKNNVSGQAGVTFCNTEQKWCARIGINKRRIFLEYYSNKQDAVNARLLAERKYYV